MRQSASGYRMDDPLPPTSACPQCGSTIPADATGGVCPRCLLKEALQTGQAPLPAEGEGPTVSIPREDWGGAATLQVSAPTPSLSHPGQHVDLPLPEELTEMLPPGAYLVEGFLGQGGMGAVYRGVQVRLKREVAIKIMRRDLGKDMDFEARFEREAQAMAKLNHPNIVSVIDFGEAGPDYLYIVMELVDGADLMDVIRGGQMTQQMALTLLPQICDALQFAHDHGIVHRDIKPSNIMLTRDGRIKMADFGLAKRYDAEDSFRTQTGTGMGTPDYAAPEQFDPRANIDHRADIYALGVMIYQMITGQVPRGAWKAPSLRAEVDPHWDEIVSRAMQHDPQDRYQQASEVKTDVTSILLMPKSGPASKGAPATKKAAVAGSGAARAKSRSSFLFSLIGSVAVLAIGAYLVLPKSAPPEGASSSTTAADSPGAPLIEAKWKPLFTEAELAAVKPPLEYKDGVLRIYESKTKALTSADGAIRAKVIYHDGATNIGLGGRMTSDGSVYKLRLGEKGGVFLEFLDWSDRQKSKLATAPFKALNEGQVVQMELRIEGRHLTGLVNGQKILEADDDHLPSPGKWGVFGDDVWFQSAEIQPLGAAITPTSPESLWRPLFTDAEWRAEETGKHEFRDGVLNIKHLSVTKPVAWADGAIRARVVVGNPAAAPCLLARRSKTAGTYRFGLGAGWKNFMLQYYPYGAQSGEIILGYASPPRAIALGDRIELELRLRGDQLVAFVDGTKVLEVNDSRLSGAGEWGIFAEDAGFESVEVQSCNSPNGRPGAAGTKDAGPPKASKSPSSVPPAPSK